MSVSRQAFSLIIPPARALVLGVVLLGTAVLVAGCASKQASNSGYSQMGAQRIAIAPPRVEIEDDGLPSQTPPPRRASAIADDPREPWSRNYGGPAPAAAATSASTSVSATAVRATVPVQPLPPARRVRLSQAEEEDIIMRAIAEHEQRRQ